MYARSVGGKELTFDFAEGLIKNNLLVVDRETSSVWSQLANKAISGPLTDTPMKVIPSVQTTWSYWRKIHPDTSVLVVENKKGRPYHYRSFTPGKSRSRPRPKGHDTSSLGLGLSLQGEALFLPLDELGKTHTPLKLSLGGEMLTVHYRSEGLTAWAEDAQGEIIPGVLAYRKGWMEFNAGSKVYHLARSKH